MSIGKFIRNYSALFSTAWTHQVSHFWQIIRLITTTLLVTTFIYAATNTYHAHAQDLQVYQPANGNWNYLSVHGSEVAPTGEWFMTFHTHYGRNPLMFRSSNGQVEQVIISYVTTLEANIAMGLHERLEFGASLPYGFSSGGSNAFDIDDGNGVGDFRLYSKVLLVKPDKVRDGLGIAFNMGNQLPTGEADRASSRRRFASNNQLVIEWLQPKWRISSNVGYRFVPSNELANQLTISSGLNWGLAAGYSFAKNLEVISEVFQYRMTFDRNPMEALFAVRMKDSNTPLGVTFGAGAGIGEDYASVEFRVLGSITWKPGMGGTPIKDRDFDLIPDARDQCPTQPEDRDQYLDMDGCPDEDNDKDGILDIRDRCANDPEDKDGFEDTDGCPDEDNDKDGILDTQDKCPLKPETKNRYQDEDGCPDQVSQGGQLISVGEKIFFANNQSIILRKSYPVLAQVAQLMKRYPEIRLIRIEGHTDNKGSSQRNKILSKARAEAVKVHLVSLGVEIGRLQSVGYGDTRPIHTNDTDQGRSLNRRVDFRIIEGPSDIFSIDEGDSSAKTTPKVPTPPAVDDSGVPGLPSVGSAADGAPYALQVYASSDLAGAQKARDAYRAKGYAAYVLSVQKSDRTIHRVRIGPYWGKVRIQQVRNVYIESVPNARSAFVIKISKTEARRHKN